MSYRCLVQCANDVPHTRQEEHQTTQRGPGDGEGQRRGKRRWGQGKGATARARAEESGRDENAERNENALGRRDALRIPAQLGTGKKTRRKGDADATGDTMEGEGDSGDVPGYVPTLEDLRLREVYGD